MHFMLKRAIFTAAVMLPCMLFASSKGYDTNTVGVFTAGITAGISVVLFPDPEHLKKIERDKRENSDRS